MTLTYGAYNQFLGDREGKETYVYSLNFTMPSSFEKVTFVLTYDGIGVDDIMHAKLNGSLIADSWGSNKSGNVTQIGKNGFYKAYGSSGDITSKTKSGNNKIDFYCYSPGGWAGVNLNSTKVVITYIIN